MIKIDLFILRGFLIKLLLLRTIGPVFSVKMPPNMKLVRLNAKLKPGEFIYFICNCEKKKYVQKKCKECGKKCFKLKEGEKKEVKKDKKEKTIRYIPLMFYYCRSTSLYSMPSEYNDNSRVVTGDLDGDGWSVANACTLNQEFGNTGSTGDQHATALYGLGASDLENTDSDDDLFANLFSR